MTPSRLFLRRALPVISKRVALDGRATSLPNLMFPTYTRVDGIPKFFSSEARTNLVNILSQEEQEEKSTGNLEMPKELASLKSTLESNWKIVESDASLNLFLKDKKVQISFHCQDTVEAEDVGHEEEEEPIPPVRFCVTTSKAGKTLVINCLSENGEPRIEGVMTTTTPPDAIHANQGDLPEKSQYQGPDFFELAEELQDAFDQYLYEECGVDSDVAAFISMYADYQEQMQYVKFLKDAQSIIS